MFIINKMSNHTFIINDTINFTDKITYEFDTLIKFIYENFVLDYKKMSDLNKNLINGDEYEFNGGEYDKCWDIRFYPGYRQLEYLYCDRNNINDDILYDDDKYLVHKKKLIQELKEYISNNNNSYKNLKFTHKSIILENSSDINHDSRGITKLDWHMSYTRSKIIVPDPNNTHIMFSQIVDALYDIKSHKFEYWYELYSECDVEKISPNTINIHCVYDHGS